MKISKKKSNKVKLLSLLNKLSLLVIVGSQEGVHLACQKTGKHSEPPLSLLQKLVLPTTKSVGKSVWKGRYPQISHGIISCVKTPWVNIFPQEFPRALTIFPQILPWIIRGFNFPQISHEFPTVFSSHFPHISVVFLPLISNDFHTIIFPTDFSQLLVSIFIYIRGFFATVFQQFSHYNFQQFYHRFPTKK